MLWRQLWGFYTEDNPFDRTDLHSLKPIWSLSDPLNGVSRPKEPNTSQLKSVKPESSKQRKILHYIYHRLNEITLLVTGVNSYSMKEYHRMKLHRYLLA